ncbi:hypothetical protein CLAIMM_01851 [Cladophialophora immunda]|nr:hypothetical protein CLAIMM_01851 [Cladophialophora immunda]
MVMPRQQDWTRYNQYLRKPYFYWDNDGLGLCCCINEPLSHSRAPLGFERPLETFAELTADKPRHPFRLVIYKRVSVEDEWLWRFCGHRVNMGAVSTCTQAISRYLFRLWHDESGGENAEGHFKSEREKQGMCADLELMGEQDIQESLRGHMGNAKVSFQSPWVSLATSLLWIFSRARALKERGCRNFRLAIVDTWNLGQGAYLFHTEALLRAYNADKGLPYHNMGVPMVLVWKEIRAPMTVVRLDKFFPSVLEKGYLKPGYLKLQPFHYNPADSEFTKNHSAKRKKAGRGSDNKRCGSRPRKPAEIRNKIFPGLSPYEAFQEIMREQQAPWRFPWRRLAGRLTQGERIGRRVDHFRVPMAPYQLDEYVDFLKREVTAIEFQFPMLIALLSTRTKEVEYDSILDAIQDWGSDDPMVRAHKQCIVRDSSSPSLPELTVFERLSRDASERLGIPVVKNQSLRKFWVLKSPHTQIPQLQSESERISDIVKGREQLCMRRKEEKAKRKAAERASAKLWRDQGPRKRRKIEAPGLLSTELGEQVDGSWTNSFCRDSFCGADATAGRVPTHDSKQESLTPRAGLVESAS